MGCLGTKLLEYVEACAHATHHECTHSTNKLLLEETPATLRLNLQ